MSVPNNGANAGLAEPHAASKLTNNTHNILFIINILNARRKALAPFLGVLKMQQIDI